MRQAGDGKEDTLERFPLQIHIQDLSSCNPLQDVSQFILQDGISLQSGLIEVAQSVDYVLLISLQLKLSTCPLHSCVPLEQSYHILIVNALYFTHLLFILVFQNCRFNSRRKKSVVYVQLQINRFKCRCSQVGIHKKGGLLYSHYSHGDLGLHSTVHKLSSGSGHGRASCLTPAASSG